MKNFDQLVREVNALRLIKKGFSLIDIVKDMNPVLGAGDPDSYRIPESRLTTGLHR
ncbi:uncharacterized protein Dvar_73350 [Desulfosarcina variabilis str. Montpellier]|uniref:hypothetical protein n=1 Tax=Desulfosarcina variabilis TaxID=2300 RepID=UPI003AFAE4A2